MMSYLLLGARRQVSVRIGGCCGHEALWREVGCAVNPTLGHRALGTEPRRLVWRVPARLGAALCSRQPAKTIDSSFCWQQD